MTGPKNTEKQRALEHLRYLLPGESTASNNYAWEHLEALPARVLDALADALQCAHDRGTKGIELSPVATKEPKKQKAARGH